MKIETKYTSNVNVGKINTQIQPLKVDAEKKKSKLFHTSYQNIYGIK
jgi:hypothetical protein